MLIHLKDLLGSFGFGGLVFKIYETDLLVKVNFYFKPKCSEVGSLHCLLTCETDSLIAYLNSILHKNVALETHPCAFDFLE